MITTTTATTKIIMGGSTARRAGSLAWRSATARAWQGHAQGTLGRSFPRAWRPAREPGRGCFGPARPGSTGQGRAEMPSLPSLPWVGPFDPRAKS